MNINDVYLGDCLKLLQELDKESIQMIYLDPPFYTQKKQKLTDKKGKEFSFSDVWSSREEYNEFIKERLVEMKRVLKKDGNIFLHCDTYAEHHLRLLLDEVFGESMFQSEIIWEYKRWSNSKKGLLSNHQTILQYSNSKNNKFNVLYTDYSPTTNLDQILQDRVRVNGKATYKTDDEGNVVNGKEKKGVPLSDVWNIPYLNPKAKERTGYPTQKPIELLKRVIEISTDEDDLVLDPFCGSGTTVVAAKLLNRNYIGFDVSSDAIELSKKRLETPFMTESNLLKVGVNAYKNKSEEEIKILKELECDIVQRNKGIDGFLKNRVNGKPVAVKIQKENESLEEAKNLLIKAATKKDCAKMILIQTKIEGSLLESTDENIENFYIIQSLRTQVNKFDFMENN